MLQHAGLDRHLPLLCRLGRYHRFVTYPIDAYISEFERIEAYPAAAIHHLRPPPYLARNLSPLDAHLLDLRILASHESHGMLQTTTNLCGNAGLGHEAGFPSWT
jgi:hypothetical protein